MAGLLDLHRTRLTAVALSPAERDAVSRALALREVDCRRDVGRYDRAHEPAKREAARRELLTVQMAQAKIGPVVWTNAGEEPKEDQSS